MKKSNGFEIQENCLTCQWRQEKRFCGVSLAGLRYLQRTAILRTHAAGTVLYREGQAPAGIFVLCNGRAKLSTSSRRGNVVILKVAEPGEALGLEAVLGNRLHDETAELMDSCQVKFLPKQELLVFLAQHNEGTLKAAYQLSASCRAAREQIRHIGFSVSGTEKLARLLTTWAGASKGGPKRGETLEVPFTHQEIAQMIGSTRETVTRVLNQWKRKEIIEVRGKMVVVKKAEELENLANP